MTQFQKIAVTPSLITQVPRKTALYGCSLAQMIFMILIVSKVEKQINNGENFPHIVVSNVNKEKIYKTSCVYFMPYLQQAGMLFNSNSNSSSSSTLQSNMQSMYQPSFSIQGPPALSKVFSIGAPFPCFSFNVWLMFNFPMFLQMLCPFFSILLYG